MDLGFGNQNQQMGNQALEAVGMIAEMQESMLDAEIHKLDNLDGKDLAKIREERVKQLKERKLEEAEWSRHGHGHLTQLTETKEFFAASKNSKRLVCHFMRPTSHHCVALNGHLAKMASLHRETRFCTFDAEKSPYLCDKILADPEGNVVIAGRSEPGARIEILDGNTVIGIVDSDDRGEWVFVPEARLTPGARILILRDITKADILRESDNAVVLVVPEPGQNIAGLPEKADGLPLAMVMPREEAKSEASRIFQAPKRKKQVNIDKVGSRKEKVESVKESGQPRLALNTIDYDDSGIIILSGLSNPNSIINVYLDNTLAGSVTASPDGSWTIELENTFKSRQYIIRVDQVNLSAKVLERIELPFVKAPVIEATKERATVIIQPGNSLWRIAAKVYGSGFRYTEIYEANIDQIRDPNLIYPGQVFKIPDQKER